MVDGNKSRKETGQKFFTICRTDGPYRSTYLKKAVRIEQDPAALFEIGEQSNTAFMSLN